jgi:hypothetical protein
MKYIDQYTHLHWLVSIFLMVLLNISCLKSLDLVAYGFLSLWSLPLYLRLHQVGNLLLDRLVVQSLQCHFLFLSKVCSIDC